MDGTYENFSVSSVEEAINETRSRVRFLSKFVKSTPKTLATKESRDVVWKISKCYMDWKNWRNEVVAALIEEGYPEAAITIIKVLVTGKMPTNKDKDDGAYKLLRNALSSSANFSDFKDFRQQLAKVGAIDVVMMFLAPEAGKRKEGGKAKTPDESDTFLVRCSLQMMLNLLRSLTYANDFLKIGATNTFASLIDIPDDEIKCLSSICMLRLLSSSKAQSGKFADDKNVNLYLIKALISEVRHDSRREFRIPIEVIVDSLVFVAQNEANFKRMIQNGVVSSICELLSSSNEGIQIRGVELFLALFADPDRQRLTEVAITADEFKTILQKVSSMNSTSVETMPVLKAKKILSALKEFRNDDGANNNTSPASSKSQSPVESEPSAYRGRTKTKDDSKNGGTPQGPAKEASFEENDLIFKIDDAMSETRLRVNFLVKFNHLSPTSLVCNETSKAFELLNDSYSSWESAWRQKIIKVLLEESYPDVALTYATFVLRQNFDTNSENPAFLMIMNLYNHICNITDAVPESKLAFAKAGFVPFMLGYLGRLNTTKQLSPNMSNIVQKTVFILYNISQSHDLKAEFLKHDAVNILSKYLNSPSLLLLGSLCLAHVLSDTAEAAKLADEKGVVKTIMELAISASCEAIRKAYVSGVGLFSLEELMEGLCLLAANDGNKKAIMANGAVDLISELLDSGKNNEIISGLDLTWTLSFDQSVRSGIRAENDKVMKPLRHLCLVDDNEIKKSAKRTLNYIERWENLLNEHSANDSIVLKDGGHIFISYSWKQQETALRIKNTLSRKGFRVWMDVDNMHSDLFERMAQAIENASVVLVCFSTSYKFSNSCRAEAEYANVLSKPVVPVNMEFLYFPDGWLGLLVRSKKCIDMSLEKLTFEEAFDQLVQEIQAMQPKLAAAQNGHSQPLKTPPRQVAEKQAAAEKAGASNNRKDSSASSAPYAKWTKADVKKWLQREKLVPKFGAKMEDFDGEKLEILLHIEKTAPEYYYTTLTHYFNDATFPDLLQLFAALNRLSSSEA